MLISHASTSCSNQPTADKPSLMGLGKLLSYRGDIGLMRSYIVERAMPIFFMRSLIRRTLMVLFMDVLLRVGFCSVDNPRSNF